jgi:hypothetical protein
MTDLQLFYCIITMETINVSLVSNLVDRFCNVKYFIVNSWGSNRRAGAKANNSLPETGIFSL